MNILYHENSRIRIGDLVERTIHDNLGGSHGERYRVASISKGYLTGVDRKGKRHLITNDSMTKAQDHDFPSLRYLKAKTKLERYPIRHNCNLVFQEIQDFVIYMIDVGDFVVQNNQKSIIRFGHTTVEYRNPHRPLRVRNPNWDLKISAYPLGIELLRGSERSVAECSDYTMWMLSK